MVNSISRRKKAGDLYIAISDGTARAMGITTPVYLTQMTDRLKPVLLTAQKETTATTTTIS